jgi:hypothetical protein
MSARATGGASHSSNRLAAAISVLMALAIGSAPLAALVAMGGG